MNRFAHGRLMIVLAAVVLASTATAETLLLHQNRGGFFGGVNFANQSGDMDQFGQDLATELEMEIGGRWTASKGANAGFCLGGFYVFQTTPTFGIEVEGQYVRRGVKIDLTASDVPGIPGAVEATTEFQIDYLEVPVLARWSPGPTASFRPVFLVGPVLSVKTGANLEFTAEGESASESASEGYKSTAIGLLGGVGFSAKVGRTSYLVVQARYYLGLTNVIDDQSELEAKGGDFGVVAGMEFVLPK